MKVFVALITIIITVFFLSSILLLPQSQPLEFDTIVDENVTTENNTTENNTTEELRLPPNIFLLQYYTSIPNYPNDFDLYNNGTRLMIAEYIGNKYSLYDTTNKRNLRLLDEIYSVRAHDIRILGEYAYYCSYTKATSKFGIMSIKNDKLEIVNEIDLPYAFYCRPYNISNRIVVFIITYINNGFYIYDVTDNNIIYLDSIFGNGTHYDIRRTWRVMYHPKYQLAIVGSQGIPGVQGNNCTSIFNVTNLSNIIPITFYTGDYWGWSNFYIENDIAYGEASKCDAIVSAKINSNGTLTVLDVYINESCLDNTHGIYVKDNIIYATDWWNGGFAILDANDPTDIRYVDSLIHINMWYSHAIEAYDDYIFIADATYINDSVTGINVYYYAIS